MTMATSRWSKRNALSSLMITAMIFVFFSTTTVTEAVAPTPDQLIGQNIFQACSNQNKFERIDVVCNGTRTGQAKVLGVARLNCGSNMQGGPCLNGGNNFVYSIGVEMEFSAVANVSCQAALTWTIIPSSTESIAGNPILLNCYSTKVCRIDEITQDKKAICKDIFTQNITINMNAPTYMRKLQDTTIEFPYTYVHLMREKIPGVLKNLTEGYNIDGLITGSSSEIKKSRSLNSQLFLQNDDADNNFNRCIDGVFFENGLRTRGCCTSKSVLDDEDKDTLRTYICTQDFNKGCCGKNPNSCSGNRPRPSDGNAIEYCSFPYTEGNTAKSFLSSTSSCWSLDATQSVGNISAYEYSPTTGKPDTSFSCCKNPACPNPCVGNAQCSDVFCANGIKPETPCNRNRERYIFPAWTPADTFKRYVGMGPYQGQAIKNAYPSTSVQRIVNMSCDLQLSTFGTLANNHTYLPQYAINDITGPNEVIYFERIMAGDDVPSVRRTGVWRTVTQSPKVRALICGRCGNLNGNGGCQKFVQHPSSKSCCGGNADYPDPSNKPYYPTIWAEKNWVIGSSPSCKMYQPTETTLMVEFTTKLSGNVNYEFNLGYQNVQKVIYSQSTVNTNVALVAASTASETNGLKLCDPYSFDLPKDASILEATGNVVLCEPAEGLARKRFDRFGPSNPWDPVKCLNGRCLPDQQTNNTLASSNMFYTTPVYYIRPAIQTWFSLQSDTAKKDQMCGRVGFDDSVFATMDDGDQVQLYTPTPFDVDSNLQRLPPIQLPLCSNSGEASKKGVDCTCWKSTDYPAKADCPCGLRNYTLVQNKGTNVGRTQSALCVQSPSSHTMCRPQFTSAKAGSMFENLRDAIYTNYVSGPRSLQPQRTDVRNQLLPTQWRDDYPNYWIGTDKSSGASINPALVMYYQPGIGTGGAQNSQCKTNMQILTMVGKLGVVEVPIPPVGALQETKYCPCRKSGQVVPGSMYLKYSPDEPVYQSTGYVYTVSIFWDNKATCIIDDGATVVVKNSDNNGKGTLVRFTCTIGNNYANNIYGKLRMTPSVVGTQVAKTVEYLLYSCDCTNIKQQPNDPSCTLTNTANGAVQFKPNPSTIEPCKQPPPATGSNEGTNPSTSFKPSTSLNPSSTLPPNTAPVPESSVVPQPPGNNPLEPYPSISPTSTPTEEDGENSQGTGDQEDQDWSLYYIIGGVVGGVVLVVLAIVIAAAVWISHARQNRTKHTMSKKKVKTN